MLQGRAIHRIQATKTNKSIFPNMHEPQNPYLDQKSCNPIGRERIQARFHSNISSPHTKDMEKVNENQKVRKVTKPWIRVRGFLISPMTPERLEIPQDKEKAHNHLNDGSFPFLHCFQYEP